MAADQHEGIILLGSNINPGENIALALDLLSSALEVKAVSNVWETLPVGSPGPNFYNAAVKILTALDQSQLNTEILRPMESRLGRLRTADKNAPRTMDLDIIIFDGIVLESRLWTHSFVAVPTSEVYPTFMDESSGCTLRETAARFLREEILVPHPEVLNKPPS